MNALSLLLDKAAIGLSAICVIHCLTLPLILALLPSLALLPVGEESFHEMLVYLVLPSSVIALTLGCKRHQSWQVIAWGGAGLVVLVATAVFGHDLLGESMEKLATVFGATLVAIGHTMNFQRCRAIDCQHEPTTDG